MDAESKQKILGAFVVGIAIVGGAYTVANFGEPRVSQQATVVAATPPARVAIDVVDADGNGVEDWRDDFFTTNNTVLAENISTTTYTPPTTLTGQIGTEFIQSVLENRIYGASPEAQQQVINSTIEQLENETSDFVYDTQDISILTGWDAEDIRAYANVMGAAITTNSLEGVDNELDILQEVLTRDNTNGVVELEQIAGYYETLRDTAIATPVPVILAKEHLDLINTYHAMAIDITAMSQAAKDPIRTLLRVRKYRDNSLGLQLALDNMFNALLPYADSFSETDPALIFNLFAIRQRI
jgi:hypothetical protein